MNSHVISRKAEKLPLRALATLENHITIATYLNQHDQPPFTLNPLGGYAPAMSSRERLLEIWQPTDKFQRLVEKAGTVYREQTISAKETPVTKLQSTSQCEDVQKELGREYQEMVVYNMTLRQL